jgi:hypothetical protein
VEEGSDQGGRENSDNKRDNSHNNQHDHLTNLTIKSMPNGAGDLWDFLSDKNNSWGLNYLERHKF